VSLVKARGNDDLSYTPAQAALILRVSPTRVRRLLQDGELEGECDEAGHWLLPARGVHDRLERLRRESFLEAIGYDPLSVLEMRGQVEDLRDQVRYLRSILSEEQEARRRADTIIAQLTQANAALTQRIPEIEAARPQVAPQEPPGYPQSAAEDPAGGEEPSPGGGDATDGSEMPWWQRLLGGKRGR